MAACGARSRWAWSRPTTGTRWTDETLDWLAENTGDDEKVAFAAAPPQNLKLLKAWGLLARTAGRPRHVSLVRHAAPPQCQLSRSTTGSFDHATPAYQHTFSGVPLLDVYDYADYQRADAEVAKTEEAPPATQ